MNTYTPDRWLVIEVTNPTETIHKVFGTWGGGYLSSDSWRINSGITFATQDEEYYYFNGNSGSVYKCYKQGYGVTGSSNYEVYNTLMSVPKRVKVLSFQEVAEFVRAIAKPADPFED